MLFISYSTKDRPIALEIYNRLVDRGYHLPFLDYHPDAGLPGGVNWKTELMWQLKVASGLIVLCSNNWNTSQWCFFEFCTAENLGHKIIPLNIDGCVVHDIVKHLQVIDFQNRNERAYEGLWAALKNQELKPGDDFSWPRTECPYPGMESFQEQHAGVYFGRSREINEFFKEYLPALRTSKGPRLIYVFGPSGSGKSSFVRAGVLPRLRFKESNDWRILTVFRWNELGRDGFTWRERLAYDLQRCYGAHPRRPAWDAEQRRDRYLKEDLSKAVDRFVLDVKDFQATAEIGTPTPLIIVDQFEELLARGTGEDDRRQFLAFLRQCLASDVSPLRCMATVRSDFLPAIQQHDELRSSELRRSFFPLDILKLECLYEVVCGPAKKVDVTFETGLVNQLVAEAQTPDALPLLAFTLSRLFSICGDNRHWTLEKYRVELGGLEKCLRMVAEKVFAAETTESAMASNQAAIINAVRAFFVDKLVRYHEAGDDGRSGTFVRQTAKWSEVPGLAVSAFMKMVELRLLTKDNRHGKSDSEATIEVTHEALFRVWPLLRTWLEEDRDAYILKNRIQQLKIRWLEHKKRVEDLCPVGLLTEAESRQIDKPDLFSLSGDEFPTSTYLTDSRAHHSAVDHRLKRLVRRLTLAIVAVIALGSWAWYSRNAAKVNENRALVKEQEAIVALEESFHNQLFAASQLRDERRLDEMLCWYLRAYQTSKKLPDKVELSESTRRLISAWSRTIRVVPHAADPSEGNAASELLSPDGRSLRMIEADGALRIWDPAVAPRTDELAVDGFGELRLSPDRQLVLRSTSGYHVASGEAQLYEVASGKTVGVPIAHPGGAEAAIFSRDGTRLLLVSRNGHTLQQSAQLCEIPTGKVIREFSTKSDPVQNVVFSPNGESVLTATASGMIQMWAAVSGEPRGDAIANGEPVMALAFNDSGDKFLSWGNTNVVEWDCGSRMQRGRDSPHRIEGLSEFPKPTCLVFHRDNVAIARIGGGVFSWDAQGGCREIDINGGATSLHVSGDRESALIVSNDEMELYELSQPLAFVNQWHLEGRNASAAISCHGSLIASCADGRTVRISNKGQEQSRVAFVMPPETETKSGRSIVAFDPDEKWIASRHGESTVVLSLPDDGGDTELSAADGITSMAFSPDGQTIAVGYRGNSAVLYSTANGQKTDVIVRHAMNLPECKAFFAYGELYLFAQGKSAVFVAGPYQATNESEKRLPHDAQVVCVAFGGHPDRLVTASDDGVAKLWNSGGNLQGQPMVHRAKILSVGLSANGERLVAGTADGSANLWNCRTTQLEGSLPHGSPVRCVAISSDGGTIATGGDDQVVQRWSGERRQRIGGPLPLLSRASALAISPLGDVLLIGTETGELMAVASESDSIRALTQHQGRINSIAFSSDGKKVIAGSDDGTASLWNLEENQAICSPIRHAGRVWYVAFSDEDQRVATASDDGFYRFWIVNRLLDLSVPEPEAARLINDQVERVAFDSTGTTLRTDYFEAVTGERETKSWDVHSGQPSTSLVELPDNEQQSRSRDGKIAVRPVDGGLQLVDTHLEAPLGETWLHTGQVLAIWFSPDGQAVQTATDDGRLRRWELSSPALDDATRLRLSLEIRTARAFQPDGVLKRLSRSEVDQRREELRQLGGACDTPNWVDLPSDGAKTAVGQTATEFRSR